MTATLAAMPTAALGRLVRPVSVVSACVGETVHAMTVDSLAPISPAPARVVLAVRVDSFWWSLAQAAGGFGVSVLAWGQDDIATHFASRLRPSGEAQLAVVDWHRGAALAAPLLDDACLSFECDVVASTTTDHQVLVVGQVIGDAMVTDQPALLRVRGS